MAKKGLKKILQKGKNSFKKIVGFLSRSLHFSTSMSLPSLLAF